VGNGGGVCGAHSLIEREWMKKRVGVGVGEGRPHVSIKASFQTYVGESVR
jgi:hypothetical protein